MNIATFSVGELYTHEEVYESLGVGNAGGIRPRLEQGGTMRRLVVMTSEPTAKVLRENPYHDRVEGDVLIYTAAGREGRQHFSGINRRLLDHDDAFPIYGFTNVGSRRDAKLGPRRWRFLGLLQCVRHFTEIQADARGDLRESLMFELLIHRNPIHVPVETDRELAAKEYSKPRSSIVDDRSERDSTPSASQLIPVDSTLGENIRRSLLGFTPEKFEHIVKDALVATGFEHVYVTRFSADGGIDVNAIAGPSLWTYRGGILQVQAKRWLHTVGRREVAELRGSLQPHAHGVVVTTSFFTKAAIAEASDGAKKPIVLLNGLEFAAVLTRTGLSDLIKPQINS